MFPINLEDCPSIVLVMLMILRKVWNMMMVMMIKIDIDALLDRPESATPKNVPRA